VARVDVRDERIRRFIVSHFRYDRERHECRHVLVAAFDDEREFSECFKEAHAEIERRRDGGEDVDPGEHISGWTRDAGSARRPANGHLVKRSMLHGIVSGKWVEDLEIPPNMSLMGSDEASSSRLGWRRRLRSFIRRWRDGAGRL
jgi:hypothetical protein